jgi:hypothetical protein
MRPSRVTKPTVVIHTNDAQLIAAQVAAHSLTSRSRSPDRFDVRLLRLEATPHLHRRDGARFVWWPGDRPSTFRRRDLQAFAPLRRLVPALLGFHGRALVLDPDVFAIGDVYDLLSRKMDDGKAILCRRQLRPHAGQPLYSSAVMLLDCGKLTHWRWHDEIDAIFRCERALGPWLALLDEPPEHIGFLEDVWNDFDTLTDQTQLLHTTEIATQPWKTGLPADYHEHAPRWSPPIEALRRAVRRFGFANDPPRPRYRPHPDPRQEQLFFTRLKECVDQGTITHHSLRRAMRRNHLRKDTFAILDALA